MILVPRPLPVVTPVTLLHGAFPGSTEFQFAHESLPAATSRQACVAFLKFKHCVKRFGVATKQGKRTLYSTNDLD